MNLNYNTSFYKNEKGKFFDFFHYIPENMQNFAKEMK